MEHRRVTTRFFRLFTLLVVALMVAAGCGDDSDSAEDSAASVSDDAGVIVCDPSRPYDPGEYAGVNSTTDYDQPYWTVVPDTYTGVEAMPLLLLLPGGQGDHDAALAAWGPFVAEGDAIVAIPELPFDYGRNVGVIRALIDDVANEYCVDPARVYALGSSSSGPFSGLLMSEASDSIAAAAIGIGRFVPGDEPVQPVPILGWTGDTDRSATVFSIEAWAGVNGCDPEPTVTDLGAGISHTRFEGCDAPVELYEFGGMGHQVPMRDCLTDTTVAIAAGICAEYEQFDLLETAAAFFEANPLRSD